MDGSNIFICPICFVLYISCFECIVFLSFSVTLSIRLIKECKSFPQGSREYSSEVERKNRVHSSTDPQTGAIQLRSAAVHPLWRTEVSIHSLLLQ